ncbi:MULTISPECIES: VOC family protein [Streptomyces]|uniref:Glyoxalase n=2 Tax=Streptomyces rimosus subsp. rimosus TaxID=132474 RepID=L8EJZ1_STRR1|nr:MULTISPECIES: VOC family protein [Streptomyces]KOG72756.1 glyoxalase [Kitasatospora aureofaciens]MYT46601.1 glyoxalase [Streptomyces sp. SID5471]KEF04507.1 glyoxalase [Streptomyces rimosus]KEF20090.1 glyoxalase [Streptomyces rimosus]KOT34055.1 glyoxalase [Streptomyces sp. NRRL WC-3701]
MITGLDHVQLAAPPGSEAALRAFYGGVLGLREIPKPPSLTERGGCWFEAGEGQLHLGIDPDFHPARKAHPALRVAGLRAYAQRLAGQGVQVSWNDDLPGHDRFYAYDPVGNRLEFLERRGGG